MLPFVQVSKFSAQSELKDEAETGIEPVCEALQAPS